MSYQQEIANWRQQRRQAEAQARVNELWQERAEQIRERDIAVANNNLELAASADDQVEYVENEIRQLVPQQPQYHPKDVNLIQKNTNYFQKYPQGGPQAALYVSNRLRQIGIPPGHPEYEEMMYRGMEFYGEKFNAPYDRK